MKTIKLNALLLVVCIAITCIACSGDCDDPQDAPPQKSNTPSSIHKDTLNIN